MNRRIGMSLALYLLLSCAATAHSQQTTRRWSLAAALTRATSAAQTGATELAMQRADFDATKPPGCFFIFCWEATEHPYSKNAGYDNVYTAQYQVSRRLAVKGQLFSVRLGSTNGYDADQNEIIVGTSVSGFALLASTPLFRYFSVGAGPAYIRALAVSADERYRVSRLGFVVDATARFPSRSVVFFEFQLQRRFVGGATVGPFSSRPSFGSTSTSSPTLPEFDQQFRHSVLALGTGIRF